MRWELKGSEEFLIAGNVATAAATSQRDYAESYGA
jgi:hypothetical protein